MEWTERTPLPTVCRHCTAKDCYNCDFAGTRWQLADIDREPERLQSEENAVQF